jgi:hypothetical protein
MQNRRRCWLLLAALALFLVPRAQAAPLGSAFTFQGDIQKNGQPYTGTAQLLIRLYDAATGGVQWGPDNNLSNVNVAGGLFTVQLDFGATSFNGDARWLEIQVKTPGDADYTLLSPRTSINAVPYGLRALNGGSGGSQWISDGPDLTYPGGSVGVTGWSSPFTSGKGVFLEGGYPSWANVYAFDYDHGVPMNLLLNAPGGKVAVNTTNLYGIMTVESNTDAAIVGKHDSNWVGVYGESQSSIGVWGKSATGIGVQGETAAAYNGGVIGYATNANGWGGYFKNTAGGVGLLVDGKAQVRTLDILGGADIVEGFDASERELQPGTVVVIDARHPGEVKASSGSYDRRVAGVVSGAGGIAPGLRLGQKGALEGNTPIAMTGRVYVRASAENGAIEPGDLLTTAETPGSAMRSTDESRSHGAILGKAMTSLKKGTGLVLVLVNLQ